MNTEYQSREIADFYTQHRNTWAELYESERWILEKVAEKWHIGSVLDVGCAAGGLGRALAEKFDLTKYVGVDINAQVIRAALDTQGTFPTTSEFLHADIVDPLCLPGQQFDLVSSFSCADWNINTAAIINACWEHVCPNGSFVISLRLTPHQGINDIDHSYQFIYFGPDGPTGNEEKANYVVFNWREALALLANLTPPPEHILGYGYWGVPSSSAVTPYDRLVFAVFALHKAKPGLGGARAELQLPVNLLTGLS